MIRVAVFHKAQEKEWDTFVSSSNNGTLFHRMRFLQYHPSSRFAFHHLMFYQGQTLVAVLPGALKGQSFCSPAGASYGSFVTKNLSFQEYEEVIDAFLQYARKKKIRTVTLTLPPIIYMKTHHETERFLLEYKGFVPHNNMYTSVIAMETYGKDILKGLSKRFKRNVVFSQRTDLIVESNNDWKSFYPILVENKKQRNALPTHTLQELQTLSVLFPKEIKLFMAYTSKKEPVAGVVVFAANAQTALAFYISHYYEHRQYRAINRLLYEALCWVKKNNFQYFDLGVSMDTQSKVPLEPSRSLILFKEELRSVGFLRSGYMLSLSSRKPK